MDRKVWSLIWDSWKFAPTQKVIVDKEEQAAGPGIAVHLPRSPFAPAPRKLAKPAFEALVVARAQLLAGAGQQMNAMHYALARNQLLQELESQNVVVMGKDASEAAAEAGGWDKI
jgi:hypothetical protein